MRRIISFFLLVTASAVLAESAAVQLFAQPKGSAPGEGSIVTPRFELPAQKSPPGFFGQPGPKSGEVKPDLPYVVLQEKSYPDLKGGSQKWIKVAPIGDPNWKPSDNDLWVFYGREGEPAANFVACDKCIEKGKDVGP